MITITPIPIETIIIALDDDSFFAEETICFDKPVTPSNGSCVEIVVVSSFFSVLLCSLASLFSFDVISSFVESVVVFVVSSITTCYVDSSAFFASSCCFANSDAAS